MQITNTQSANNGKKVKHIENNDDLEGLENPGDKSDPLLFSHLQPPEEKFDLEDPKLKKQVENQASLFVEFYKTKDKTLREKLINANMPLVTYILAKYYNNVNINEKDIKDDLLQEGTVGLMTAIDGFNPELGYKFSTYGAWWIQQTINNYLVFIEPSIKIPGHIRSAQNKLTKQLKEQGISLGDVISGVDKTYEGKEIPGFTKKMFGSITSAFQAKFVSSLDTEVMGGSKANEDNSLTAKDLLPDASETCEQMLSKQTVIDFACKALKKLTPKEKIILLLRFDVISFDQAGKFYNMFSLEQKKKAQLRETQTQKGTP